jgi:hypothetical protein
LGSAFPDDMPRPAGRFERNRMNEIYDNRAKFIRALQATNARLHNNFLNLISDPDFNFLHIFKKDNTTLTFQSIFWNLNNPAEGFASPLDFKLTGLILESYHTSTSYRYTISLQRGIPNNTSELPIKLMTACAPAGTTAAVRTRDFGRRGIDISRREALVLQTSAGPASCTVAVIGISERPYFAYEYQVNP